MSSASPENDSANDSVTARVRIDAAPEVVFPYLIDASLMVRWIGEWAELDPVPGGVFALNIESAVARGTFLVVEKVGEAREQIKRDPPRSRHR